MALRPDSVPAEDPDQLFAWLPLIRVVVRNIVAPRDIEDVVQDAILEIVRMKVSGRSSAPHRGYIAGIARHVALASLRQKSPEVALLAADEFERVEGDGGACAKRDVLEHLLASLAALLSEREQLVVGMAMQCQGSSEISRITGLDRTQIRRALRRFIEVARTIPVPDQTLGRHPNSQTGRRDTE